MNNQSTSSDLAAVNSSLPVTAQNAQPPADNPLDKLRDIHLPEPIDAFPYAPGWWILLAILLIFVGYFIYRQIKYRRAIRLLIPAKHELAQLRALPAESINAQAIASLSALLKRVCLVYFAPAEVAALNGAQWLEFLNYQAADQSGEAAAPCFDNKAITLFSQAAYQKSVQVAQTDWLILLTASERCIEFIITDAARRKLAGKLGNQNGKNLLGHKR